MLWDDARIVSLLASGLRGRASELDAEGAPLGVDALDELPLHPILASGLSEGGLGVLREQRYPAARSRSRRSEGDRCDLVLTEQPGMHLTDPLMAGTLFGERGVSPEEALWLEVKVAAQFCVSDGWSRANPLYSGVMLGQTVADIRKLSTEPGIAHAGLVLVMFNSDETVAGHDLKAWYRRCIEQGLPISAPLAERFAITDRIGNGVCTAALVRVHHS